MESNSTSTIPTIVSGASEDLPKKSATDVRSGTNRRKTMRPIDADRLIEWWKPDVGRMFYADNFIHTLEFAPTIKTKEIKYYDEDEQVWKIGRVIVDEAD